jgi:hypothetical protein
MKLAFTDFWDGFQPHNNFFLHLFGEIYKDVELVAPSEEFDVLIYSCFGDSHKKFDKNKVVKIFYAGEKFFIQGQNAKVIEPNFEECTYSFSYEFNEHEGKNVRIPLWLLQIDWFDKANYVNPEYVIPLNEIKDNEFIRTPKDKFCVFVNNSLFENRIECIEKLNKYKKVDCYGKPFKNWFYGELNKYKIISQYKFIICFENFLYSGYHTEKLVHAKSAGCVPIYSAEKEGVAKDFNVNSFINLEDFGSMDELVDYIIKVDNDDDLYNKYKNEPIFNEEPSLNCIKKKIHKMLVL